MRTEAEPLEFKGHISRILCLGIELSVNISIH